MWQWRVTGLWRTSILPQDKRRMYLLSERRGGRRPATRERAGDVRDRVQFKRKIKAGRMDREAAPQRRPEEWAANSDKPVPEGTYAFPSQATQSRRAVADSTHTSDTYNNGILAQMQRSNSSEAGASFLCPLSHSVILEFLLSGLCSFPVLLWLAPNHTHKLVLSVFGGHKCL